MLTYDELLDAQHETRALTEAATLRGLAPRTRLALIDELDALEAVLRIASASARIMNEARKQKVPQAAP